MAKHDSSSQLDSNSAVPEIPAKTCLFVGEAKIVLHCTQSKSWPNFLAKFLGQISWPNRSFSRGKIGLSLLHDPLRQTVVTKRLAGVLGWPVRERSATARPHLGIVKRDEKT